MTRDLITGGAGFIGSHLVDALLARGDEVSVLDTLSTGRLSNLTGASNDDHFSFVQGSVLDELAVDEAVRGADVVVHLAAAVGVKLIVEQPLFSLTTNIKERLLSSKPPTVTGQGHRGQLLRYLRQEQLGHSHGTVGPHPGLTGRGSLGLLDVKGRR